MRALGVEGGQEELQARLLEYDHDNNGIICYNEVAGEVEMLYVGDFPDFSSWL